MDLEGVGPEMPVARGPRDVTEAFTPRKEEAVLRTAQAVCALDSAFVSIEARPPRTAIFPLRKALCFVSLHWSFLFLSSSAQYRTSKRYPQLIL